MNDREMTEVTEDWKVFKNTKGFEWLINELNDAITVAMFEELNANPLDFTFRPWKYAAMKAKRKGAENLKDQILRLLE